MKSILITGGAGFIGSNLVEYFVEKYPDYKFVIIDLLTYAGDIENLKAYDLKNFIYRRTNEKLQELGLDPIFEYDEKSIVWSARNGKTLDWQRSHVT